MRYHPLRHSIRYVANVFRGVAATVSDLSEGGGCSIIAIPRRDVFAISLRFFREKGWDFHA